MRTKIEQQVMAGVGTVYVARKLVSRTALECYALFLCAFSITLFVSLPHVFLNFESITASGLPGIVGFILSAVLGTKLVVQLTLVVGTVALLALARDVTRATPLPKFA